MCAGPEAARAYDSAAVLYLDDFARLNLPQEWPPERRAEVRARRGESSFAPAPTPENGRRKTAKPDGAKNAEGERRKTEGRGLRTAAQDKGRRADGDKAAARKSTRKTQDAARTTKKRSNAKRTPRDAKRSSANGRKARPATGHGPQATAAKRPRKARGNGP